MKLWRDLGPVFLLFFAERRLPMLGGAAIAATTVLSGIALLGLSGWFITATAIAGLSATTALAFDVFAPAAAIRFLAMLRTGSRYAERLVTHDATLGVLASLRERLFRGWAEPGAARQLLARPSRLLFRLTEDIDALGSLYLRVLVPAGAAIATAVAGGIALGLMSLPLGIAVAGLLVAAGLGLPVLAARRGLRPAWRKAQSMEALRAHAIDLVAGQTELAMAGRLAGQRHLLAGADRKLVQADDAINRIETAITAGFALTSAVLLSGTMIAVGALADARSIDAPLAALALLIVFAAVEPFAALKRGAVELGRTLLAARHLSPRLVAAPPRPTPGRPPHGIALRLSAATVRHEGAHGTLFDRLSLEIRAGEHVAVIGASGAGKSTLLALAAGELPANTGTVEALRGTLFTQRTELFRDSLRDNLCLADPAADDERFWAALRAAGLEDDVRALPLGLDTALGEGALGLSGGQARRLAIARLLLCESPLWFLDEPTEGLDAATAGDILKRLFDLAQGKAVVVATHLRREAIHADRLLVMDRGRIVECLRKGQPEFDAAIAGLRPD